MRRLVLLMLVLECALFGHAAEDDFLLEIPLSRSASPYLENSRWFEAFKASVEGSTDYTRIIEGINGDEESNRHYINNQTESLVEFDQLQPEFQGLLKSKSLLSAHGETEYYIDPEEKKVTKRGLVEIIWNTDYRLYCVSEKGKGFDRLLTSETQDILIDGPLYLVTEKDLELAWDKAHSRGTDQDIRDQMELVVEISKNRYPEKWRTFVDRCREKYWPSSSEEDEVDWDDEGESDLPIPTENLSAVMPVASPEVPKQSEVTIRNAAREKIRLIRSKKTIDTFDLLPGDEKRVPANTYDKWCYTDAAKLDCRQCWFNVPEENEGGVQTIFWKSEEARKCTLDFTVKGVFPSSVAIKLGQKGHGVLSWKIGDAPPKVYAHLDIDMKITVPGYEVTPSTISGSSFHEGEVCRKTITLTKTKHPEIKTETDEVLGAKVELRVKEESFLTNQSQADDEADMYDLLSTFTMYASNKPTPKAKFKQNVYEFQNTEDPKFGEAARKFKAVLKNRKMSKEQYLEWAVNNGLSRDFEEYLRK